MNNGFDIQKEPGSAFSLATDNEEVISVEELIQLMDLAECAIFTTRQNSEMEILYANARFYSMLQYSQSEFREKYGNRLMAAILPEDKQKLRNLIARQTAAGGKLQLEYRVQRKDGTIAWILMSASSINKGGQITYYCSCMDVTKSKKNLAAIYEAKRDIDLIANSIPGGVIKLRMSDFKLMYANDGFFRLAGYSKEEYHINFGDHCDQVIDPADREMVQHQVKMAVENRGLIGFEYRIISKTGEVRWSYINGRRVDDIDGAPVYLCVIMDITSKKMLEKEFEEVAYRVDMVAKFMKETTWTYDIETERLSRSGNLDATYSQESVLTGMFHTEQLQEIIHPDDLENFEDIVNQRVAGPGQSRIVIRMKDYQGIYRRVEVGGISVCSEGKNHPDKIYGITRLVESESIYRSEADLRTADQPEALENKLVAMAKSAQAEAEDTVTGLLPYAAFLRNAAKLLAKRGEKDKFAVICADINEFHKFNHHYGFSVGNEILKQFSRVLQRFITSEGLCSRVDGDYFVGILPYAHHKELLQAMSKMCGYLDELDSQDELQISYGTAVGLYLVEAQDRELGEMLEKADLARRSIKGMKGNLYVIYTEDLQKERFKEEEVIQEIWKAMKSQSVEICYMPRIHGTKENIIGCKAVPRIQLKDGQYIESDGLQRYIERGGKLEEFPFYTLYHVCCNVGAWKAKGNEVIPFSIEMTAIQLCRKNAVATIEDIVVHQNKLKPSDIIFEVQERFFADMASGLQFVLEQLCRKGFQVVISRFGSDHTAIHTLRSLPVTGIKFHGEYFADKMTSDREKIILKHIVQMARDLNMTVTCGGIHTKLQEDFAREIGCDVLEGEMYYGAMRSNVFEKCFLMK